MARCKRVFGLGLGYLQALLLAMPYSVDALIWHTVQEILGGQGGNGNYRRDAETTLRNHITINSNLENVIRLKAILTGVGRLASLFVVQKVNCKFVLLGITLAEVIFLLFAHSLYKAYGGIVLAYAYLAIVLLQGPRFPFSFSILTKWTLPRRMTSLYGVMESAREIILACTLVIIRHFQRAGASSELIHIYTAIAVKTVFCVLWTIFGAADPMQSLFVPLDELAELRKGNPRRIKTQWKNTVPWRKIFVTPILYGCVIFDIGNRWSYQWEMSEAFYAASIYMSRDSTIALVGLIAYNLASLINAFIMDYIIKREVTTVNNIRKTTATITAWGTGVCFLMVGYTLKSNTIMTWVVILHLFKIANFNNDAALIIYNVSPNYVGFNYGFISGIGYLSLGFKDRLDRILLKAGMEWVMYTHCFLMMFSCLTMLLSGTCHLREFDSFGTIEWKDESFVSFP